MGTWEQDQIWTSMSNMGNGNMISGHGESTSLLCFWLEISSYLTNFLLNYDSVVDVSDDAPHHLLLQQPRLVVHQVHPVEQGGDVSKPYFELWVPLEHWSSKAHPPIKPIPTTTTIFRSILLKLGHSSLGELIHKTWDYLYFTINIGYVVDLIIIIRKSMLSTIFVGNS